MRIVSLEAVEPFDILPFHNKVVIYYFFFLKNNLLKNQYQIPLDEGLVQLINQRLLFDWCIAFDFFIKTFISSFINHEENIVVIVICWVRPSKDQ